MIFNNLTNNSDNLEEIKLSIIIPKDYAGKRLDQSLAALFPTYSRENLKQWILNQSCLIDGKVQLPKFKLKGGEEISINAILENKIPNYAAQNLPLDLVYEDLDLLIINKPYNLVVHPGAGNWDGTLLNGLINYLPDLKFIPRAGIVHRLDQDTSGLMIIAKTLSAYNNLVLQFKHRLVSKIYVAIVHGSLISSGSVDLPIGRNQRNRLKMQVTNDGKAAITHYTILKKFKHHTYIKLKIETGRTHQIRVHMKHINHPILGDQLYGKNNNINNLIVKRQALHAKELKFIHPKDGKEMSFTIDLPQDLQDLLKILEENN